MNYLLIVENGQSHYTVRFADNPAIMTVAVTFELVLSKARHAFFTHYGLDMSTQTTEEIPEPAPFDQHVHTGEVKLDGSQIHVWLEIPKLAFTLAPSGEIEPKLPTPPAPTLRGFYPKAESLVGTQ